MMGPLPRSTRVVIIGGGVVGCSVAYHLAKLGWRDVLLLERKKLTSGTTWHAAGLIGQLRATANMTKLARYGAELYGNLEAETGVATGFRRVGSLSLALTSERLEELRRGASMARAFDVDVEEVSVGEASRRHPLVDMTGVLGAIFLPRDGQADPGNVALAMARGATQRGATILENVRVTGITQANGRVTGVQTDQGPVAAEIVVNCAGMWGREVGRMAGVHLPLQACEHFYVVSEPSSEVPKGLPVLRVTDECAYYKEDAGKIMLGAFEPKAKPWGTHGIPDDFCFDELPADLDHFSPILETATRRMPLLGRLGIRTFFNGPESFTHDNRYLLGETPEVGGFYVACGFNSVGIQSAGGAGKALAEWIVGGAPPFDLWDVDVRRTYPFQATRAFIIPRVSETLGLLYADHFPYRQFATSRGVRRSPVHDIVARQGAFFGDTAGYERPQWFVSPEERARGITPEAHDTWGRPRWFANVAAEHRSVRERVGLFDMSPFGKVRVEGRDAEAVLQRICANDIAVPPGRIVYTQWLNERGGIEADVTITRLGETSFLVVTGVATVRRELAWLARQMPAEAQCVVIDVSCGEACLGVMGPRARDLLQAVSPDDLSDAALPFATARSIELGMAHVRAHRISYVGELGYELYVPSDFAGHVLETILAAGEVHDLRPAGLLAMDSLRLEKAYRHFGHDISDEDHVLEAGLGFAVKTEKQSGRYGPFIGRDAVLAKRSEGVRRRLVQFKLDDPGPLLFHTEPVLRDGRIVAHILSGGYGHTLGAAIGLAYVPAELGSSAQACLAHRYEIEVAGQRFSATASLKPLYDPTGLRTRG
ncbi:MAG: FAD-dependent oxidoreductase [Hyphomicrobiaceae bacterium]